MATNKEPVADAPERISPVENSAKYDPSKNYTWNKNDVFYLPGSEFGAVLQAVRTILATEEAQKISLAQQANHFLTNALARAVESGIAKEQIPPIPPKLENLNTKVAPSEKKEELE